MKPRILIVSPVAPYPPTTGAQLRLWNLLRLLRAEYAFHYLYFSSPAVQAEVLPQLARIGVSADALIHNRRSPRSDVFSIYPRCILAHRSGTLAEILRKRLAELQPELVQFEFLWMAQYQQVCPSSLATVLVEHDAEWRSFLRYGRRVKGFLKKAGALTETLKLLRYEKSMLPKFSSVVAVSESDRAALQKIGVRSEIDVIGQGVDCESITPGPPLAEREGLIFVGNLAHFPNEHAVLTFTRSYLPIIRQRVGMISFRIVGMAPSAAILALESIPKVTVTGPIERITDELHRARIFVCPMFCGGGMRGKILEAMAAGVPVVSTPMGVEGIAASNGEEVILAQSPPEFAKAIELLLTNQTLADALTDKALSLVRAKYDWRNQAQAQAQVYNRLLRRQSSG